MLVSRESVQALMPHQSLTKINGAPTHVAMKKLEKSLPQISSLTLRCRDTPPAASPPAYPAIPPGATVAVREELRATNDEDQQNWQTMLHVRRIAVNLAAAAIDDVYYAELDDPVEGLNSVEIQDIVDHIKDRYCHIDQADLDKNLTDSTKASIPPFRSSFTSGNKRTAKNLRTTATSTSQRPPWSPPARSTPSNAVPSPTHGRNGIASLTWLAWKTHWTRAFEEQKTIQRLTGNEFSANSTIQGTDDELASQMVTSLDNLAFAAVQKNETVEKLIEMNAQKDKTIAALTTNLTTEKATTTKLLDIITRAGLKATRQHSTTTAQLLPNGTLPDTVGRMATESQKGTPVQHARTQNRDTRWQPLAPTRWEVPRTTSPGNQGSDGSSQQG
eukprot:CCRYP_019274-RA/>CCRYP_019274-RA protein AED:0.67 eAED:0.36 QI:0/0/0/0.66/1/1/3/0/387